MAASSKRAARQQWPIDRRATMCEAQRMGNACRRIVEQPIRELLAMPYEDARKAPLWEQAFYTIWLFAVFMPVAMIWVAALAARSARTMREESRRLQAARRLPN